MLLQERSMAIPKSKTLDKEGKRQGRLRLSWELLVELKVKRHAQTVETKTCHLRKHRDEGMG